MSNRRVNIEISIENDEVRPDIFIAQRESVFDAQGNTVGVGKTHRSPILLDSDKNASEQLAADPNLHLTDKEAAAIKSQIDGIKAALPTQARPTL